MEKEKKILLVDDELDFARSLAFWLKSRGYSAVVESNTDKALAAIKEDPPDLVFLDIVIPQMNGLVVLKKIREFDKNIPVIMMSSYVKDTISGKDANFYNVSGVFSKEHDFSKVLVLIESAFKDRK